MTTPADSQHPTTHSSSPKNILEEHIEQAEQQTPAHRPRILIVEDHAETGLLMQYALRERYRTEVAASARGALQQAAATIYDGFLIDISLRSKRNGIDVLEALRARTPYRHASMVAVTAHALPGDRERFLSAGFDGYVSKPFTADELRATVHRLVKPRRMDRVSPLDTMPAKS